MRQKSQSLTIHGKFFDKQHGTAPQEATLEYQYINKKSVCLFRFYFWINQCIYYFLSFIYHFNKHYGGHYDAWWQMPLKFPILFFADPSLLWYKHCIQCTKEIIFWQTTLPGYTAQEVSREHQYIYFNISGLNVNAWPSGENIRHESISSVESRSGNPLGIKSQS